MTNQGRAVILLTWLIVAAFAYHGTTLLKTDFNMEYFIPAGSGTEAFMELDIKYF